MNYGKLRAFPLGSITASGFLLKQLLRCKDGMGGHLDELDLTLVPYGCTNLRITYFPIADI